MSQHVFHRFINPEKKFFPLLPTCLLQAAILSAALVFAFPGCTHEHVLPAMPDAETAAAQGIKLTWTAFKFTNRTAISGTFDDIRVEMPDENSGDPKLLPEGARFDIRTASVSSQNAFRDGNIASFFFQYLLEGDQISGSIQTCTGDFSTGQCIISLRMNDIARDVTASYAMTGHVLVLEGDVDLANWEAQPALDNLNSHVVSYHTGPDGVNKLWQDVHFKVEMPRTP